jgi:hypothetical protein
MPEEREVRDLGNALTGHFEITYFPVLPSGPGPFASLYPLAISLMLSPAAVYLGKKALPAIIQHDD